MGRRITNPAGQSMPLWLFRVFTILFGGLFLAWVFFAKLFRGVRSAFHYAWIELRIAFADILESWQGDID